MKASTTQYHPRHQWINDAAVDFHLELSKPDGVRNDEKVDSLRSEILSGLQEYLGSLSATRLTIGIHEQDDYVHDLLLHIMGDTGWLMQYDINNAKGTPFLGYIAGMAKHGVSHTTRKEFPGSGRTQDALQKYEKGVVNYLADHPDADLDDARLAVLNRMTAEGLGMEQIKNIRTICDLKVIGTDDPTGDGITVGDSVSNEHVPGSCPHELSTIDRTTLQIKLDRMPPRYRQVLDSMIDQGVEGLHEIKFGTPMTLAEKAVVFSTAIQIGMERTTRILRDEDVRLFGGDTN